MSTIVVVRKEGFVAIAADSLTTWGLAKESAEYVLNHQKIIRVRESYLGFSGPTSAKLAIKDYFASNPDADLSNVDTIFRTWLALHAALKKVYFLHPTENENDAFESTQIDTLIANPNGIFGVAAHRAVQEFSRFYAYGTGWQHALGAMFALYADAAYSADKVASAGIEAPAAFDVGTGLPIDCYSLPLAR
jgi:ATP-dependent HslUV protease, peptidase subunit HslV